MVRTLKVHLYYSTKMKKNNYRARAQAVIKRRNMTAKYTIENFSKILEDKSLF
jgi:hypothetical protein